jgi:glutamate-1-semialdehyde 2,1-aminomutase
MNMSLQGPKTRELYERAKKVLPYGVNSNFRYWGDQDTMVIACGKGAYIWDPDGRRYIDYRLGFGPVILGHSHPAVVKKVQDSIEEGTMFAWTTPNEIRLAEKICRICKVDKARLTNTGTEATMHALRLARAHTGREKFIKFEGMYHGFCDYFLFSTASSNHSALGSRRSPVPSPISSGIPQGISQYVTPLPFNDFERVEETVKARWGDIAAIFVEPLMGNSAGILPKPGFLEKLRELCDAYGIVLVFDEVKTGFRIALGGAQEYFGVQADLVTYAKAIGNGFPIAAIAGKEEVLMTLEPGGTAQGGTYSGNMIATAAALATLEIMETEPVHATIEQRGRALMAGMDAILTRAGIPHAVTGHPAIFSLQLGSDRAPRDFRDYIESDERLYEELAYELIHRGVMPDADGREPWFLCYALSEEDVAETLNAFEDSVKAIR